MKYKFQHYVDIATSAESMQIINFNVGGADVIRRCAHLFNAYKYFKLGKVSVKFVPASTLPVDPLGLSYDDSDPQTVDPRDQLNPGLVRITNGEDLFTDLTNVSSDEQMKIYEAMMLDPRWYKFSLQSGFKRTATPLYWQVGQLQQDNWPGAIVNVPAPVPGTNPLDAINTTAQYHVAGSGNHDGYGATYVHFNGQFTDPRGFFQTGHRGRLGYLPTDAYQQIWAIEGDAAVAHDRAFVNAVPQIRVITAVLPKMHKTNYFYRCYITEEVYFSGLRSIAPFETYGSVSGAVRGIDQFIVAPNVTAWSPPTPTNSANVFPAQNPMNDGSGDDGSY